MRVPGRARTGSRALAAGACLALGLGGCAGGASGAATPSSSVYGSTPSSSSTSTRPSAAATPVAPSSAGNIRQKVSPRPVRTQAPVALDARGDYANGMTVTVTRISRLTTKAQLPGEVAGPGVRMAVTFTNRTSAPVDLSTVVVDLQDATGRPAAPMTAKPAHPLRGTLARGTSASGVFVFTLGPGFRQPASILVTYAAAAPVVVFRGALP